MVSKRHLKVVGGTDCENLTDYDGIDQFSSDGGEPHFSERVLSSEFSDFIEEKNLSDDFFSELIDGDLVPVDTAFVSVAASDTFFTVIDVHSDGELWEFRVSRLTAERMPVKRLYEFDD